MSEVHPLTFRKLDGYGEHPLFHSDRGFQYTSNEFKRMIDKVKMTQSMSRVGKCIDNSPMESFWGTLKYEKYYLHNYDTFKELSLAIDKYIYTFTTMKDIKKD